MIATVNDGHVDISVDFTATIAVSLEPGVWPITHRGAEYSITRLDCRVIAGHPYFTYPKGVPRRPNGQWSAQERILPDALPADASARSARLLDPSAWSALPADVRSTLEDAYLLARHELPEQLGAS